MTCIVGLVEKGEVFIGGDSAGIAGWQLTVRKDSKVFRNGDFLIGGTSSFRMLQLLHHAFEPPKYTGTGTDWGIEKYMAVDFVNAIRQCFKDGGFATKNSEAESGGNFLIGFQGRLFEIEADYQVGEPLCGYTACGCGADVAIGSFYASSAMAAKKRVLLALKAAEAHNAGVRGPFVVEELS